MLSLMGLSCPSAQNQYYISSSTGSDANIGTESEPWQTLEKISNTVLNPGDTVYFMRGDSFFGHFEVNGSGSQLNPLVITA
ncbi:MAG: hypothetical protein VXY88_00080, partial [Bacteroidota bacterium]|nr:hypothetical protein [Bacteroidota bacterium]